jgi:hypothetical protein
MTPLKLNGRFSNSSGVVAKPRLRGICALYASASRVCVAGARRRRSTAGLHNYDNARDSRSTPDAVSLVRAAGGGTHGAATGAVNEIAQGDPLDRVDALFEKKRELGEPASAPRSRPGFATIRTTCAYDPKPAPSRRYA